MDNIHGHACMIATRTRSHTVKLRVCNEDNFNAAKPFLHSLCSLFKYRNKLIFAYLYVPRRALVTDHASMGWDHLQQGGTRYGCDIWSGGTDYSAVDSPGGPLFREDCPRRDMSTICLPDVITHDQISRPYPAVFHTGSDEMLAVGTRLM